MQYHMEVRDYFESMGVSVILLLRRNLLKRLVSILANEYDRLSKPLNGTHKAHVHSVEEVLSFQNFQIHFIYCLASVTILYEWSMSAELVDVKNYI